MSSNQPSSPHGDPAASEALKSILRELWRYKFVVPAVAVLVTAAVAFRTLRQPKIYSASTTLEYDPHPAQPLGNAVDDAVSTAYWNTQEFYETQNFILRSRAVAERVVRKLGLHRAPEFADPSVPEEQLVADLADGLLGQLSVDQVRDTRIVTISITDQDPDHAALLANTFAEAYIDKSLEDRLGTSARALEWLSDQMKSLKSDVENSELALYKFREENHSLSASLEERQKIIAGQLQSYSQALTELHANRIKTSAKLTVLQQLLAEAEDPTSIYAGPLAADNAIINLREKCREAALHLQRLSVTYGAAHPQVQTAQGELNELRTQLRNHVSSIIAGVQADLKELELAEKGIQGALDQVNQQGLELSLQEVKYVSLDRDRTTKSELYDLVVERAAQTNLTRALRVANARIVDRATVPTFHISPNTRNAITIGVLLGLFLGVAVALGIAQLDNKVRGTGDIESRGLALLGVLPSVESPAAAGGVKPRRRRAEDPSRDLIVHWQPRSSMAECCRTIRTNITFQSADQPLRTIAVTSATPRDGKTTVAISLAITLAQSGRRVLLVDTDLRRPRVHKAFGLANGAGVTSVIAGEATLEEAAQASEVPSLHVLPCGPIPPNPSELLHTRRFAELLAEAREKFDTVVFDTPPVGAVTDPAIIATQVDGTLLVVRSRATTRAGVDAAIRKLRDVSARLVGAVLNGVNAGDGDTYYAQYRGYYAEDEAAPPPGSENAAQSRA